MNHNAEMPLVSIIVPVYKVEIYLRECIDSILSQSYNNIEVILVDDGSPDSCPIICDEYAQIDNRVCVIHQQNGGLSVARNAGLDIAHGKYVMFVDSDDLLENDAIETLLTPFSKIYNVGISFGMVSCLFDDGTTDRMYIPLLSRQEDVVIAAKDFARLIFDYQINIHVWNKLFKRELLLNVRFVKGRNSEDHLFAMECSKQLQINNLCIYGIVKDVYVYRLRADSIMTSTTVLPQLDSLKNFQELCAYYYAVDIECYNVVRRQYIRQLCDFVNFLSRSKLFKKRYFKAYRLLMNEIPLSEVAFRYRKYLKKYIAVRYFPYLYLLKNKCRLGN